MCDLWHREAEFGNLCIIYKWNSDFVWQHKITVYDILNNAVTQTTVKERERKISDDDVKYYNIKTYVIFLRTRLKTHKLYRPLLLYSTFYVN